MMIVEFKIISMSIIKHFQIETKLLPTDKVMLNTFKILILKGRLSKLIHIVNTQ